MRQFFNIHWHNPHPATKEDPQFLEISLPLGAAVAIYLGVQYTDSIHWWGWVGLGFLSFWIFHWKWTND